jgi:hypothetical protein
MAEQPPMDVIKVIKMNTHNEQNTSALLKTFADILFMPPSLKFALLDKDKRAICLLK